MHFTQILLYSKPLNPTSKIFPLRFKELRPLKLKNAVSTKGGRGDGPKTCLQPMTEMFECFKKNEFSQTACASEILAFKTCSEVSVKEALEQKRMRREGTLVPGSERLTSAQANVLLRRYPQYNDPSVPDRWS